MGLPLSTSARVRHKTWGEGQVLRYEDDNMVVLFNSVSYKTLAVELVVQVELLEAAQCLATQRRL